MTILLTFAGNRDPIANDTNQEGSVVTLCRWFREHGEPVDKVWLLSMDDQGAENAHNTQDWLVTEQLFSQDQVRVIHRAGNPVDFESATRFVFDIVQPSPASADSPDRMVHFNGTSGTPAMKTAGLLLSAAGLLHGGRVWTVLNPDYVIAGNRVSSQDMEFFREHMLAERLATAVAGNQFQTAITLAREWGRSTVRDSVRQSNEVLIEVLRAYRAWDLTDFSSARRHLKQVSATAGLSWSQEGRDLMERQRRWLNNSSLDSPNENPFNLVELHFSIERYQEQERHTDALSRARRLIEGLVYYHYRTRYDVDVRRAVRDWMHRLPEGLVESLGGKTERNIPLWTLARAVMTYQDSDAAIRALHPDISVLSDVMDIRNQSLAAHGMQPVSREEVENILPLLRRWLATFVPSTEEYLRVYPLTPRLRDRVLRDLGLPSGGV